MGLFSFTLSVYYNALMVVLCLFSDCGIIASRLQINLDDLLWVLTDSQLKAALVFVNSLKDVIAKSARLSKKLAAERLKVCMCT